MENIRQSIMDSVINQFNQKGMKFTMDDIARDLHISKKTIYREYDDKDELFLATVDYGFAAIKQKEAEILKETDIDIVEKISRLVVCLPDSYKNIDFRKVYLLRDKYPEVYARVTKHIESDWEETEKLIVRAMDEGKLRKVPVSVVKLTIEGAIEKFLSSDELFKSDITYEESLNQMIDIIMNVIRA